MVKNWQKYRQIMINATLIGAIMALILMLINSEAGNRQIASFDFPQTIPLSGWQLTASKPLTEYISDDPKTYEAILAAHEYQYQQHEQTLNIKNYYIIGTLGNIITYNREYVSEKLPAELLENNFREQPGLGFYTLVKYHQNYRLMACINPQGGSTVTTAQFLANRSQFALTKDRIMKWLLGQESLRDRRCLFTELSLAKSPNYSSETILEQAWFNWFQWWIQNFPRQ